MTNKISQSLNQDWEFQKVGDNDWHDATVPGCVHQDLFANDLIPDPFFRVNESKLQWIMDSDWSYRLFFTPAKEIHSCFFQRPTTLVVSSGFPRDQKTYEEDTVRIDFMNNENRF